MTGPVIGITYDRWKRIRETPTSFRNPAQLWLKAVWYKANPRSSDYMRALLAERYPDAKILDVGFGSLALAALESASKIVLLYPDAIGLGYSWIERDIARRAPHVVLEVLNGRRRQFTFDHKTKWALQFRRVLEWTMFVECTVSVIIIIVTPFLLVADFVRGKI